MSGARHYNSVHQSLTKLFKDSREKLDSLDHVNAEINWILQNRNRSYDFDGSYNFFNGKSVTNLWLILKNYNYGYKNPKYDGSEKQVSLKSPIPEDIWKNLLAATVEQRNNITLDELKIILSVFKHMNIWQNADEAFSQFRQGFLTIINYFFPKLKISQTLVTLKTLGYQWDDLPDQMQKDIYEIGYLYQNAENPDDLLNLLWACIGLNIPSNIFGEKSKKEIINKLIKMITNHTTALKEITSVNLFGDSKWKHEKKILRQIQQVRLYFNFKLENESQLNNMLDDCVKKEIFMGNKNYKTFQDSVNLVIKTIASEYNIDHNIEASPLHLKPVDVYFPESRIILELNGPHHYNLHGILRPQDIMNKTIYEKNGYHVSYIKQSDWDAEKDKYNFILNILKKLGIITQPKIENNQSEPKNKEIKQKIPRNSSLYSASSYLKTPNEVIDIKTVRNKSHK